MLTMDVFNQDAFSAISLTMAVDRYGYVPTTLGSIPGLVTPAPVATRDVFIERRANAPALIHTSPLGAPPSQKGPDLRDARPFKTKRIARGSRITAEQLQGVRAFGSETELQTLQLEMGRRTLQIRQDFALTKEFYLFNMIQGLFLDADGSQIYSWADEFEQVIPAEVTFGFSASAITATTVREYCAQIRRTMSRNLQGLGGDGFRIVAICGDSFWDALTSCLEVRETYLNWAAAADIRNDLGRPWTAFRYGDINFINYRGTDDQTTLSMPSDLAYIFPVGAGIFQWAMAPAERMEFVSTLGRDMYNWVVLDQQRNMWADLEYASYPLPVCIQPQALASAHL